MADNGGSVLLIKLRGADAVAALKGNGQLLSGLKMKGMAGAGKVALIGTMPSQGGTMALNQMGAMPFQQMGTMPLQQMGTMPLQQMGDCRRICLTPDTLRKTAATAV